MISADDVRGCRDGEGVLSLFRRLGYPIEPVEVDRTEWTRAGVDIPWAGTNRLHLAARLECLDVFFMEGRAQVSEVTTFLSSYAKYNVITKSVLINYDSETCNVFISALAGHNRLRRLAVSTEEPTAHALDRLNLLALEGADVRSAATIVGRALDREAVTRRFFMRFRSAVREVAAALVESCPNESNDALHDQALLILSRLLFLSFIQEKGWLNGERRFLANRIDLAGRQRRSIFTTVLMPLFFGCLNTPAAERDEIARGLGTIPYLNGGLFEPSRFELRNPALHISDDVMRRVIDEVFERFDFTTDESESAGMEVDPEMLGKVFESLMAEDERAASGSFYTPKEIVDVLAGRAIVEWLSDGDHAIRALLTGVLNGTPSDALLTHHAPALLVRIELIAVLDPACGSGAFLLSALRILETLTRAIWRAAGRAVDDGLPQRIVERSLFGVDLKPEAVRLCELRLWLAIVSSSEETAEKVRPLPNLDRNILQGNALIGPLDFLVTARADVYAEWAYGLRAQRDLIERYRSASRAERPAVLRVIRANDRRLASDLLAAAIENDERELQSLTKPRADLFGRPVEAHVAHRRDLQSRLAGNRRILDRVEEGELDFFAFDIHFATVMSAGGFDVVMGNPPWVRNSAIDASSRKIYRDRFALFRNRDRSAGSAFHQPDLSVAFFERAFSLASPRGVVSLLMPAKIANASYAAPLRRFAREKLEIVELIDWTDERRRFFAADTFPLGIIARPGEPQETTVTAAGTTFTMPQRTIAPAGPSSEWSLVPPDVAAILTRLRLVFPALDETLKRRPLMGVKTGDNKRFFLEARSVERGCLITGDGIEIPTTFVCRCVRGRDVRRWSTSASQWMLWPPRDGWRELPAWLQQFALRRGVEPESLRLSFVRPEHVGIKVAWKDVSRGISAVVLPDSVTVAGQTFPLVPNQTLYSLDAVSLDEAYLFAGILNSVVVDALLLAVAERAKDDYYRYFGRTVERIPLPRVVEGSASWLRIVRSARVAHQGGSPLSDHDQLVAGLYGVSSAELETLRSYVHGRLRAR